MLEKIKQELEQLKDKSHINPQILEQFFERLKRPKLTKTEHEPEHLCTFFVPLHQESQSVYLIDHIKGQDWMPPGGHLEPNEHPLNTVKREFQEELGQELTSEPIELFHLSLKPITNHPLKYCTLHYDLWYLVWLKDKPNFQWDRGEFHHAGWFKLSDGLEKVKDNPDYKNNLQAIYDRFFFKHN